jgi:excisionase family DNA binding protein
MEPKRSQDFSRSSRGPYRQTEHFAASDASLAESLGEPPGLSGGRKPVASVRHPVTARAFSGFPGQPAAAFEPLLDLHEASAILGMHWKTLEAKARGHEVPAFKVGKRWRFRLSSLNSWLEHGINSNTTDHAAVTRQERCS